MNLQVHQHTNQLINQLINQPTHQLANSSTHKLINSQSPQLITLPIHNLKLLSFILQYCFGFHSVLAKILVKK